jgi:hypothetical protein
MYPIGSDTNTANLVAAIAASLAALASSISVIISVLALRRTTEQTDILTKQFDLAEQARKESARPRLTVEISKISRQIAARCVGTSVSRFETPDTWDSRWSVYELSRETRKMRI